MSDVNGFRKFHTRPEEEIKFLHSPFIPGEVYDSDPITLAVRFVEDGSLRNYIFPVYRLSPLGVEVDITNSEESVRNQIKTSLVIDATLKLGRQFCEFQGLVVATKHKDGARQLFGVRWCRPDGPREFTEDRRKAKRWLCGEEFLPTGVAPNPTRFNDFIVFRVLDISSKGMQLATSMRNKYLVPGMQLEATITFPTVAPVEIYLRVVNARISQKGNGEDFLSLGVQLLDPDKRVLETIGQYVLQFGPPSTSQELRDEGLAVRQVTSALEFSFVKTAEDYRQVLALRHSAYSAVGKIDSSLPIEVTGDIYDSRAKILMAKHRGNLVGSLRIMFHDPEDPMEHEQFMSLSSAIPRKDEIAEVTRVCTDPNYRGADLFYGLMKHMMLTIAQSKRRWLLGSATEKLMPLYKKIGFRSTGDFFSHADLGNEKHEIILGDVPRIISGVGVGPVLWNELYADVSDYLRDQHGYEFDPMLNVRMSAYRAIAPITRFFTAGVRKPRAEKP